jgi:hypothetical protein
MRHNPGYGIMQCLVRSHREISSIAVETFNVGQHDLVAGEIVIGAVAIVPDHRRKAGEHSFEARAVLGLRQLPARCEFRIVARRQPLDLIGVEYGELAQQPPGSVPCPIANANAALGRAPCLDRVIAGCGFLGCQHLVEDRTRAFFTFADLAFEHFGLTVRHPVGRSVAALFGDHPQEQCVDAAIGRAAVAQRP